MLQIEPEILLTYGALYKKVAKGEFVFTEGAEPHNFFQLLEGEVKMISLNQDGKELIQGIFTAGQSFGEPPLFICKPYPASAIAVKDTVLLCLTKSHLLTLLLDHPNIALGMIEVFANRLHKKAISAQILSSNIPEDKILSFLEHVKSEQKTKELIKIPYTRQQIADFTGLCVETVIRTLLKLNEEKKVEIKQHKIFY